MNPPLLRPRFEPLPGNHTYLVPVKLLEVEQKNGGGGESRPKDARCWSSFVGEVIGVIFVCIGIEEPYSKNQI